MSKTPQAHEIAALRGDLERVQAEMEPLATRENITPGENEHLGRLLIRRDRLAAELQTAITERTTALEAVRNAPYSMSGDGAQVGRVFDTRTGQPAPGWGANLNRGADPWADDQRDRFGAVDGFGRSTPDAIRSRAESAVEQIDAARFERVDIDSTRQKSIQLIQEMAERGDYVAAEHILAVSDPNYRSAFSKVMRRPHDFAAWLTEPERVAYQRAQGGGSHTLRAGLAGESDFGERAAMSLTAANGGNMLPFLLDPTIILTNDGAINPIRKIARTVTGTANIWHGVSSAGVTAEWLAEAAESADASPTVSQPSVTAFKGAAYVQASVEFYEDGNFESELGAVLADAKNNLESTAFVTGNGTTQPHGIVTALQAVTASRVSGSSGAAGAATLVIGDLYALDNDLPSRWSANASWLGHKATLNSVRRMGEGSTGTNSAFWTDLGGGQPAQLIGYPAYQSSAMDSTIVSGSTDDVLILGAFRQFVVYDRIGMSIAFEPMVRGANRRPTGEVSWFCHWRVGSGIVGTANAFRLLRL